MRCLDSAPCLACDSFEEFEIFVHKYSPRLWIRDWLFPSHAYVKQNKEEKIIFSNKVSTTLQVFECRSGTGSVNHVPLYGIEGIRRCGHIPA